MTMQEIEAKVLEVDPDEVAERLDELGAEQVFAGEVRSRFYDFPDGRIEEEGSLRLRELGDEEAFLTYKQEVSRDGAKEMTETEFTVGEYEEVAAFLELLGLEEVEENTKHRQKWYRGELEYVVDTYPGVPPLLEIEAPDRDRLDEAMTELGYDPEDAVYWDAAELLEHYDQG